MAQPQYIGSQVNFLRPGFIDPYPTRLGSQGRSLSRFNQFHADQTNCPGRAEGLWILTQLARWGVTPFPKNWVEILERVRRVDLFGEAARQLGWPDMEPDRKPFALFDGVVFDPDDPLGYLDRLAIKGEVRVEEIILDAPVPSKAA